MAFYGDSSTMEVADDEFYPKRRLRRIPEADEEEEEEFDLARPLGIIPVLDHGPRMMPPTDTMKRKQAKKYHTMKELEELDKKPLPKGFRDLSFPARPGAPSMVSSQQRDGIKLPAPDKRLSISTQVKIQEFLNSIKNFEEELELEEAESRRIMSQNKLHISDKTADEGEVSIASLMNRTQRIPEFKEELFLGEEEYEESLSDLEKQPDVLYQTFESEEAQVSPVAEEVEEPDEEEEVQQSEVKQLSAIAEEDEEPDESILEDEMQRFENLLKNFDRDINYAKAKHGRIMIENEELDAFREPL